MKPKALSKEHEARLEAARAARRNARLERWKVGGRRRADRTALEREALRARAVRFVRSLFAGNRTVEVRVVFQAAAEQGITTADLMYAAARAGVRRVGWVRGGTAPTHEGPGRTYWGIPAP